MPKAVKLTQETVMICAQHTEQPVEDVQAWLELSDSRKYSSYVVIDFYGPNGVYVPHSIMRDNFFNARFMFPFGENPKKFEHVVTI